MEDSTNHSLTQQDQPDPKSDKSNSKLLPAILITGTCVWLMRHLPAAWLTMRNDLVSPMLFVVWCAVIAIKRWQHVRNTEEPQPADNVTLTAGAIAIVLGNMAELNVGCHLGLACVIAAWWPANALSRAVLVMSAVCWTPALNWFCAGESLAYLSFIRVSIATVGLVLTRTVSRKCVKQPQFRTSIPVTCAVLAVLAIIWEFHDIGDARQRLNSLPLNGFGFQGRGVSLSDVERQQFKGLNCLKRRYRVASDDVLMLVVDGSANRHAVHDPMFCHLSAGWQVLGMQEVPLANGSARLVSYRKAGVETECLFYFSDGRQQYSSAAKYWWQCAMRRVTLGHWSEEPVLVVLQPATGDPVDWTKLPDRFLPLRTL
jgi:hypothetical protein